MDLIYHKMNGDIFNNICNVCSYYVITPLYKGILIAR